MTSRIVQFFGALAIGAACFLAPGAARIWLLTLASLPFIARLRREWGLDLLLVTLASSMFVWPLMLGLPPHLLVGVAFFAVWWPKDPGEFRLVWRSSDAAALVAMGLIALPIGAIWSANGMHGDAYWARGWYERDCQWMWALAQEAANTGHWPTENPWVAGLPNVYASWLHMGLGWISTQGQGPAVLTVAPVVTVYMVAVAGLMVHALATRMGPWMAVLGWVAYELMRPDVYPISQSLAMGGLALLMWHGEGLTRGRFAFACIVALSHPLVGVAAVAYVLLPGQAWTVCLLAGAAMQGWGWVTSEESGNWFFRFNSSRFAHLALLLALPEIAPRFVWTALLAVLASPPSITTDSIGLYTGRPVVADADLLRLFEWIRTSTPPSARFVSLHHSMLLPGFTGRSQWPFEERGTYGRTGLTLSEFNARLELVRDLRAENAASLMRANGYGYLLGYGEIRVPGLHVAHREGSWVVLELDPEPEPVAPEFPEFWPRFADAGQPPDGE